MKGVDLRFTFHKIRTKVRAILETATGYRVVDLLETARWCCRTLYCHLLDMELTVIGTIAGEVVSFPSRE